MHGLKLVDLSPVTGNFHAFLDDEYQKENADDFKE